MKTDLCPRVTNLPPVAVVEQEFARPREPDVRAAVFREMHRIFPDAAPLLDKVRQGLEGSDKLGWTGPGNFRSQ